MTADNKALSSTGTSGRWFGLGAGCGGILLLLAGVTVGLVLPAFARKQDRLKHLYCAANLRQISQASATYAEDYDGEYPPGLAALYPDYIGNARLFKCPATYTEGWRDFAMGQATEQSSGYIYLPGRFDGLPENFVLAYDKPGNHRSDVVNAVFVDGHIQTFKFIHAPDFERFEKMVADQEAQLPELRRKREEEKARKAAKAGDRPASSGTEVASPALPVPEER